MSSATKVDVAAAGRAAMDAVDGEGGIELTPRQKRLSLLWSYFKCTNYDGRKADWDGTPYAGKIEHEAIATQGFLPAGFTDPSGSMDSMPLKYRRPTAPFYLARVIVFRFNSLLFSSKRHPKITCPDPVTEDWLQGFAEATRLWAQMTKARTYGGAMGTAVLSTKVVNGKPFVEVHDPRWCTVSFEDRDECKVKRLEKRYQFRDFETDPVTGEQFEALFWYRRVIDVTTDTVWPRVLIESEDEPKWEKLECTRVEHNNGFCPVVWLQNTDVDDDIDGEPDCQGIYDTIEAIDALWAQANRGTISNCDPAVTLASDAEFAGIKKGSGAAMQVEKGGSINYLEINGEGIKTAIELAEKLEDKAKVIARCVLDTNFDGPARTDNEVTQNYSNMLEQADTLREQYGERGVKRILEMALRIAHSKTATYIDRSGPLPQITRGRIVLPKKRVVDESTGMVTWVERELGTGETIELKWPGYSTPSLDSVAKAVDAAGNAHKTYGLVDRRTALQFVSEYLQVEDVDQVLQKQAAESAAEQALFAEQAGYLPSEEDPNQGF